MRPAQPRVPRFKDAEASQPQAVSASNRLHNTHPGEMLASEFMEPLGMSIDDVAQAVGLPRERIEPFVAGERAIDAELDLRLGRFFKMSEGFFLRLQVQHDLIDAKRALNGELERIIPRAA